MVLEVAGPRLGIRASISLLTILTGIFAQGLVSERLNRLQQRRGYGDQHPDTQRPSAAGASSLAFAFLRRFVAVWLTADGVGYVAIGLSVLLLPQ